MSTIKPNTHCHLDVGIKIPDRYYHVRRSYDFHEIAKNIYGDLVEFDDCDRHAEIANRMIGHLPDYWRVAIAGWLWNDACWEESCSCPKVWAAILKHVYGRGRAGSLIVKEFGYETTARMFNVARRGWSGFYYDDPLGRSVYENWTERRVFRGGRAAPSRLATGMSWSLSIDVARGFASRGAWGNGDRFVISTIVDREDVFACFDHECEVVIEPKERAFEVLELVPPGPFWSPSNIDAVGDLSDFVNASHVEGGNL